MNTKDIRADSDHPVAVFCDKLNLCQTFTISQIRRFIILGFQSNPDYLLLLWSTCVFVTQFSM